MKHKKKFDPLWDIPETITMIVLAVAAFVVIGNEWWPQ